MAVGTIGRCGCGIIGRVTSMPLAPGTRLGAYEIRSLIGRVGTDRVCPTCSPNSG